MRVSEDRYYRDLRRLNLAMRLIRLEARTRTIRECTGLGDDRIRRLYHAYLRRASGVCERHRGCSPRSVLRLMSTPRLAQSAAVLAAIGVCVARRTPADLCGTGLTITLSDAEQLCDVFDLYREVIPEGSLSFEQALCVMRALWRRNEIEPARCQGCGALVLRDLLSVETPTCAVCATR